MSLKKKVLTALSLVLILGLAAMGILAYLTNTSDVARNTMTTQNVKIEQIEQERDSNGVLGKFTQDKPALPAVYEGTSIPYADSSKYPVPGDDAWKVLEDNEGVVDKFVTVKNTGSSDAYVRTIVAFEVGENAVNDPYMHLVCNGNNNLPITYDWVKENGEEIVIEVDGSYYKVCEFTYTNPLKAGETSIPSIKQVYLDKTATNEVCAAYGEKFEILVLSQAVQASGFDSAEEALNEAFGEVTAEKAIGWFSGATPVSDFEGLKAAFANGGN